MKSLKAILSDIYRYFFPLSTLEMYRRMGVEIGENCWIQFDVVIDHSHYWHIKIGNNVIIAPRVHILAHDSSMFIPLGHAKLGNVVIKDNVFIGAGSIIMPGVTIEERSIIGAGSIVTKDVPAGEIYAGNPAKFIMKSSDFIEKQKALLANGPTFGEEYTLRSNISKEKQVEMAEAVKKAGYGFVI